ncbi:MAG: ECF-type sigma factor, partial [Acidobacteriota bacterium]
AGDLEHETAVDLVALDEALQDLSRLDRDRASLVELRFFAGLSIEETAEVLGVSRATVIRQWRVARAWLFQQLHNE